MVRYTSFYYQSLTLKIWKILLLTTPLDLLLLYLPVTPPLGLYPAIGVLLLIAFMGTLRDQLFTLFFKVRTTRERIIASTQKIRWLLPLAVLGGVVGEFALKTGQVFMKFNPSIFVPIIFFIVVLIPAYRKIKKSTEEKALKDQRLAVDRIYWVEEVNKQIFILNLAPILAARALSLCALIESGAHVPHRDLIGLLYFFGALALSLALYPSKESFILPCKRCGFPTSRALQEFNRCPKCDFGFFQRQ